MAEKVHNNIILEGAEMRANILRYIIYTLLGLYFVGCTGVQTFGTAGRAGDTIAIASGWNQEITRNDITVQITDSENIMTPLTPRAVINAFPDPLSNLIIESYTDLSGSPESGMFWAPQIDDNITNGDKDYSQQIIFLDLPATLNPGAAQISITGPGVSPAPIDIEILPLAAGPGSPHTFGIQETLTGSTLGVSVGTRLRLAERAPHNTVTFTGSSVPHAIEVTMTHAPDFFGGASSGVTYVTSPRSDIKNIAWSDTGTVLTVIMTPSRLAPFVSITNLADFKFFVAGGITGLTGGVVSAYDIDGNPVPGISCAIDGVAC